jgi:hypothetical protein
LKAKDIEELRLFLYINRGLQSIYPGGLNIGWTKRNLNYGEQGRDFRLQTLEAGFNLPNYSDIALDDYTIDYVLRADGVKELLNIVNAYEAVSGTGKYTIASKESRLKPKLGEKENDFVQLSSFKNKKPVVLMIGGPKDFYMPNFFYQFEYIYNAYKDKVEFYYIVSNAGWYYIGMKDRAFFKTHDSLTQVSNSLTLEERARIGKLEYMGTPYLTVPCLLDTLGNTTQNDFFNNGGGADITILDINGKVVDHGQGFGYALYAMNEVELSIRELLNREGKCDPDREEIFYVTPKKTGKGKTFNYNFPRRGLVRPQKRILNIQKMKIIAIEKDFITVSKKFKDKEKKYELRIDDKTRIYSGVDIESANILKVGASLTIEFKEDDYLTGSIELKRVDGKITKPMVDPYTKGPYELITKDGSLQITGSKSGYSGWIWYEVIVDNIAGNVIEPNVITVKGPHKSKTKIWICGEIKKVNEATGELVVKQMKPDAKAMKGYGFWKNASDGATMSHEAEARMKEIEKWLAYSDDELNRKIKVDKGTHIFVNGNFDATIDDFKVGDFIGLEYHILDDSTEILANQIRISKKIK